MFREALNGSKEYAILLELSQVNNWSLSKVQEELRVKEIKSTLHSHKSIMGTRQRRQEGQNNSHGTVPRELHLPLDVYHNIDHSNPLGTHEIQFSSQDPKLFSSNGIFPYPDETCRIFDCKYLLLVML